MFSFVFHKLEKKNKPEISAMIEQKYLAE